MARSLTQLQRELLDRLVHEVGKKQHPTTLDPSTLPGGRQMFEIAKLEGMIYVVTQRNPKQVKIELTEKGIIKYIGVSWYKNEPVRPYYTRVN